MDLKIFNKIENWKTLTETTKKNIINAHENKTDSISEFVVNESEKTIVELIQNAQSLANPQTIGVISPAENWKNYTDNRYGYVLENIKPYSKEGFSSYCLKASYPNSKNLILPQVLNFAPGDVVCSLDEKSSPRLGKFVSTLNSKLNVKVQIAYSLNKMVVPFETKISNKILKKDLSETIVVYNDGTLNDYKAITIILNLIARNYISKANFSNILKNFSEEEVNYIKNSAEKLATLGLVRATYLANPEVAFKLDEALKLDFFTTLGLLNGKRANVAKIITNLTKDVVEKIVSDLGYNQEKIESNMKGMGFEYPKEPENIFEAIYYVNNLKKVFNLSFKTTKANSLFASSAVSSGGINFKNLKQKIRNDLPGYIQNCLLTKEQAETFPELSNGNIIQFVLDSTPNKYPKRAQDYVPEITEKFSESIAKMVYATTKYVDDNQEKIKTRNPKKLLKEALNEGKEKPKGNQPIIKDKFKEDVKHVINSNRKTKKSENADEMGL